MVDLADDVAFEAADDVAFAESFGSSPGDVVDGGLVESHSDDYGVVDGGVQLPVPTMVDSLSARGHAGGCRDGG